MFTATAFIPTGLEVATAAGTTVAAQKVLEAIFGDQAIRALAEQARTDLLNRVHDAAGGGGRAVRRTARGRDGRRSADGPRACATPLTTVAAARRGVDLPAGAVPPPGLIKTAAGRMTVATADRAGSTPSGW